MHFDDVEGGLFVRRARPSNEATARGDCKAQARGMLSEPVEKRKNEFLIPVTTTVSTSYPDFRQESSLSQMDLMVEQDLPGNQGVGQLGERDERRWTQPADQI